VTCCHHARGDCEQSQQATLRALGDDRVRAIVEQYIDAWERGDVDGMTPDIFRRFGLPDELPR
jgi:hypothetical protein